MRGIMIAGTHSGSGKTTVTCAILQALTARGLAVSSFKCGPDYIDPMFHSRIIGTKSRNIDRFFCDKDTVNHILHQNTEDIAVVEGVMGFYDGLTEADSSYAIAMDAGLPVILVVDCKGMSLSIGAVLKGYLTFRQPLPVVGIIFNRLPEKLLPMAERLCEEMQVTCLGRFPFSKECSIESRHLGLVTAAEITALQEKTKGMGKLAEQHLRLDKLLSLSEQAKTPEGKPPVLSECTADGKPVRIAVAMDNAFCFYYADNLELLEQLGGEIVPFSPLTDGHLPENIHGLILGGGYPELYAQQLSANVTLMQEIRQKISGGLPTIAECGGFLYLHKTLENAEGTCYPMVGVIDGTACKTPKLQRFGYTYLTANKDTLLCEKGKRLSSHEFHYWDSSNVGSDFQAEKASNAAVYPCIHANERLYAGFPHLYFYAEPNIAVRFIKQAKEYEKAYGTNQNHSACQ